MDKSNRWAIEFNLKADYNGIIIIKIMYMDKEIQQAINNQIKEEIHSAYIYLGMAAYCEGKSLKGFANWFKVQAQEEMDHAMGLYKYIFDRGGQVELQEIPKVSVEYSGISEVFEETLKHEQYITNKINELYKLAVSSDDFALQSFLKWYIDEQVEEEEQANDMIEQIKRLGDGGEALFLLDKDLGLRVYAPGGPYTKTI